MRAERRALRKLGPCKALSEVDRDHIVLATKVHGSMGEGPNNSGNSRRWIMRECDNSLRRGSYPGARSGEGG